MAYFLLSTRANPKAAAATTATIATTAPVETPPDATAAGALDPTLRPRPPSALPARPPRSFVASVGATAPTAPDRLLRKLPAASAKMDEPPDEPAAPDAPPKSSPKSSLDPKSSMKALPTLATPFAPPAIAPAIAPFSAPLLPPVIAPL